MDDTSSQRNPDNTYLAFLVIGALLPWILSVVVMWISWRVWRNSAINLRFIAATLLSLLGLTASIKYYRCVLTPKARWVFALSPVAFWPLHLLLIFVIGVVAGRD